MIERRKLEAGLAKRVTPHTLRHSFATHWLENAEGSHEIALLRLQLLLGHTDIKTTMRYLHVTTGMIAQRVSPLDQLVLSDLPRRVK